ncbi:MAG: recombinase family protein [Tatlockia sp.]|nr:recombinase family protein [Tatlockia sp.]
MKIGYARISTKGQHLDLQIDALKKAGCEKIYKDIISGSLSNRPALDQLLNDINKNDVIIIWKLDRLGRSLKNLVDLINTLNEKEVGLKSINDPVDTTTAQGRLIFNIFGSLAEFERELIKERTLAGLEAAREKGNIGGRPKGLTKKAQNIALTAEYLYKEEKLSVNEILEKLCIGRATLYRYLRYRNVPVSANIQRKTSQHEIIEVV